MLYLILILASIGLFAAFLGLTVLEARSGARVLASQRVKLDKIIAQYTFIAKHVDWGAFVKSALQSAFERVIHMLAPKPSRTPMLVQMSRFVRRRLRILGKKLEHDEF